MFVIETKDYYGHWSAESVGHPNEFATAADAAIMIDHLKTLGEEWAEAEYRIVERERTPQGPRGPTD